MEDPGPDPVERGRWHVRQAMARAVALQYLSTGEAQRLVAAMRAYQQADRRLLERLGRNPGPEELAQELGKPVTGGPGPGEHGPDAALRPRKAGSLPRRWKRWRIPPTSSSDPGGGAACPSWKRWTGASEGALWPGMAGPPMSLEETARDLGLDLEEAAERERRAMLALRCQNG